MRLLIPSLWLAVVAVNVAQARGSNRIPVEAKGALENPSKMVLASISPTILRDNIFSRLTEPIAHRHFHGWRLFGKTNITDRRTQRKIASAVEKAVENSNGWMATCFNPRHAVEVVAGSKTYLFIICYECYRMEVYCGDSRIATLEINGPSQPLDEPLQTRHIKQAKRH